MNKTIIKNSISKSEPATIELKGQYKKNPIMKLEKDMFNRPIRKVFVGNPYEKKEIKKEFEYKVNLKIYNNRNNHSKEEIKFNSTMNFDTTKIKINNEKDIDSIKTNNCLKNTSKLINRNKVTKESNHDKDKDNTHNLNYFNSILSGKTDIDTNNKTFYNTNKRESYKKSKIKIDSNKIDSNTNK